MIPKLTVVILNWARPANVDRFAAFYATHDRVDRVFVVNNGCPPGRRARPLVTGVAAERLTVVDADRPLGLQARFAFGALARTDQVLIVDDDVDLPDDTVRRLHGEFLRNSAGAVGLYGRVPTEEGTYTTATRYGPVPVLITRAVVTTPDVCADAAAHAVAMSRELGGEPFGNGEDVVMSFCAMRRSGRLNLAFRLPHRNPGYADANAVSRWPGHEGHRTRVYAWCIDRFGPPPER